MVVVPKRVVVLVVIYKVLPFLDNAPTTTYSWVPYTKEMYLQIDFSVLVWNLNGFFTKIHSNCCDISVTYGSINISVNKTGFAHTRIAQNHQFYRQMKRSV